MLRLTLLTAKKLQIFAIEECVIKFNVFLRIDDFLQNKLFLIQFFATLKLKKKNSDFLFAEIKTGIWFRMELMRIDIHISALPFSQRDRNSPNKKTPRHRHRQTHE